MGKVTRSSSSRSLFGHRLIGAKSLFDLDVPRLRNQGKYVCCVTQVADRFRDACLMSQEDKEQVTSEAAESDCRHKK